MPYARNVEIRARVRDLQDVRDRVVKVATSGPEILLQRDTCFEIPKGRLKLRETKGGIAELIHYERPNRSGPKVSHYTRVAVADADAERALLARVHRIEKTIAKRREVFLLGRTRIHLDEVEGLGAFIELEVVLGENEPDDTGEKIARALMRELGIREEDLIDRAYVDLADITSAPDEREPRIRVMGNGNRR